MTQQRFHHHQQAWGDYPATISNPGGNGSLSSSNTTSPPSSTSSSYLSYQNYTSNRQQQQQSPQPYYHHHHHHHHHQMSSSSSSGKEYDDTLHRKQPCKCSQCDPNYYTVPLQVLHSTNVEYVCRDCQFVTHEYQAVQRHEGDKGHRRWYSFPQ